MNKKDREKAAVDALTLWRNSLIDLTGRNRLLGFKKSKTSTLRITVPDTQLVIDRLLTGRNMRFQALLAPAELDEGETEADGAVEPATASKGKTEFSPESRDLVENDANLLGAYTDPTLMGAVLRTLHARTTQAFLDTGLWTLFLAVGNLAWTDPQDKARKFNSPLLLVPVELIRQPKSKLVEIRYMSDDTVVNPALQLALQDYGITLPDADDTVLSNVIGLIGKIQTAVSRFPEWKIDEEIYLSYFTFHKEAMYRDLLDNEELLLKSEHILAISNSGKQGQTQEYLFDPVPADAVDHFDPPETSALILDADASQRAAVIAAREGHSFVLDGPPGTGKSQTIANIIATLMAQNRTVLFVSEKAAALEVVKNRLEEVGLSHGILELHSHKATRKEVSAALSEAVGYRPTVQGRITDSDRRKLARLRGRLTHHADAMNTPRDPLGLSLHQAMGRVSRLEDLPSTPLCDGDFENLDADQFANLMGVAQDLQRAWPSIVRGVNSPWYGIKSAKPLSVDAHALIDSLEDLEAAFVPYRSLARALEWDQPAHSKWMAYLIEHWRDKDPDIPKFWLTSRDLGPTLDSVSSLREALQVERDKRMHAHQAGGPRFAELVDAETSVHPGARLRLVTQSGLLESRIMSEGESQLRADQVRVESASRNLLALREHSRTLAELLGIVEPKTLSDVSDLLAIANIAQHDQRPEPTWITTGVNPKVADAIALLQSAAYDFSQAEQEAGAYFDPAILESEPKSLQIRFSNTHRGMRKLGGAYRSDLKILGEGSQPGIRAKDNVQRLELAVTWQKAKARLDRLEEEFAGLLGERYNRERTDWQGLRDALDNAVVVAKRAKTQSLETLNSAIGYGSSVDPQVRNVSEQLSNLLLAVRGVEPLFDARAANFDSLALDDIATKLDNAKSALDNLAQVINHVDAIVGRGHDCKTALESLDAVHAWAEVATRLDSMAAASHNTLGDLYTGTDTPPEKLEMASEWIIDLHRILSLDSNSEGQVMTDDVIVELDLLPLDTAVLSSSYRQWRSAVDSLKHAFHEDRHLELETDLSDWIEGRELTQFFADDVAGQAEYLAGQEAEVMLSTAGLEPVISSLIDKSADQSIVAECIERELLRRWIDLIIDNDEDLGKAGSKNRDAAVTDFQKLDRQLIASTVADIVDKTNAHRPTTSVGQSQILISQGMKKRNLLPIRSLISSTWDVTKRLKPVFMMSPLSVSQFLEPNLQFDVVIFDEASQVLPEDAVNAIYRGHQLIIAGDDKQLPPTKFFALSDDENSTEESESEAKDYESILDLAKASSAYKSLTLSWHYRSRHQDLITFSNKSFYDSKLITFPSSDEVGNHVGVEFFHVSDGVYGRSGSRRNMPEARFVARRVEHHFDTRPDKNLGVVTFSQSQAEAVESAVSEMFERRDDLVEIIDTSRLGGFFIKNLESVQGDERDVMIFSIGYGPDDAGKLNMTFGPVTGKGGGRRLNVAVTRARYRNEIVASFQPSQMRPGASEGLRHLTNYLDYAVRGPVALALDDVESQGPAESPFEESVADWLRSKGWDVVTQVGTLGYRIDMAVRHPNHPGRFLLGVECDGRQYHSSQTARDRDRLRQEVLEGLGWTLHRIWGPSWYRQRRHEQERIEQALESALEVAPQGRIGKPRKDGPMRPVVTVEEVDLESPPKWVIPYRIARPKRPPRGIDASTSAAVLYLKITIEEIVKVEAPIHRTVLDARIRTAWGIGRISAPIRRKVDAALEMSGFHPEEDFFYVGSIEAEVDTRQHNADSKRDIEHVHPREVQDTVWRIVKDATAVRPEDAALRAARYLGFMRVGPDVNTSLNTAIQDLVKQGFFTLGEDGLLRLGESR